MKRDLEQFNNREFDILIVGAGIYGACLAWEAALRGLKVALIDKSDFGGATSANSLKIIHGGLRYLQQLDIIRTRTSSCERTILMRIAPHLVHPLKCLMPTYGHLMRGKEVMKLAFIMNDIITFDRNRIRDPEKHIPNGATLSRSECLSYYPNINKENLTGAALWTDAQAINTERLTISFVQSAVEKGAVVANYTKAKELIREGDKVLGVKVRDLLTGKEYKIKAKMTINSGGPWKYEINKFSKVTKKAKDIKFAKAFNIITRNINNKTALALRNKSESRFLFIAPWNGYSLIGTEYIPYIGKSDHLNVSKSELQEFIDVINRTYPALDITLKDVLYVHKGLVPLSRYNEKSKKVSLTGHFKLFDHEKIDKIKGIISVLGVKYTTARREAKKVIDYVTKKMGLDNINSNLSSKIPVYGGDIQNYSEFLKGQIKESDLDQKVIECLIQNYGTKFKEIIEIAKKSQEGIKYLKNTQIFEAEILYSVRNEMVEKLSDVVLRRTELGAGSRPNRDILEQCANIIAKELKWDSNRVSREIEELEKGYEIS